MPKQSEFYIRFFDQVGSRLDENYNHPRYEEIETLLSNAKYKTITLGDPKYLYRITKGRTPKGIVYLDEGIPFLGAGNIYSEKIDLSTAPRIDTKFHQILKKSQLKKGNVLATMAGTIGNCAAFELEKECNCNQAIAIMTINQEEIVPRYLAKYLNSRIGQLYFNKLQKIADQPNIGFDEIKTIQVILPDHDTQIEILKQMEKIENKITELDQQKDNLIMNAKEEFEQLVKKQ